MIRSWKCDVRLGGEGAFDWRIEGVFNAECFKVGAVRSKGGCYLSHFFETGL